MNTSCYNCKGLNFFVKNTVALCATCGEFNLVTDKNEIIKCEKTPEELADLLGLVEYGKLLIDQRDIYRGNFYERLIKTLTEKKE